MIKLNDIDISTLGFAEARGRKRPQTPNLSSNIQAKASYGAIDFGGRWEQREFTLDLIMRGNLIDGIRGLKDIFLDVNGNIKKSVKYSNTMSFDGYFNVTLGSQMDLQAILEREQASDCTQTATLSLILIAVDPFEYNEYKESISKIGITAIGGYEIPIDYIGNSMAGFTLAISGTIGDFYVELSDGQKFIYNSDEHATYMVIDFDAFTIDDNGSNGLVNSTGDWLYLNKEITNLVIYGNVVGNILLEWRARNV